MIILLMSGGVMRRVRQGALQTSEWEAHGKARLATQEQEMAKYKEEQDVTNKAVDAWPLAILYYNRLLNYLADHGTEWERYMGHPTLLSMNLPTNVIRMTQGGGPSGQWDDVDQCLKALLTPHGLMASCLMGLTHVSFDPTHSASPGRLSKRTRATIAFAKKIEDTRTAMTLEDVTSYVVDTGLATQPLTEGQVEFLRDVCVPHINENHDDQCFDGITTIPKGDAW